MSHAPASPAVLHTPRVVSGIQPSGFLHLGNYLGALKKFIPLHEQHACLFFIADLHAITVWQDPAELRAQTRHIAAAMLASGVDPKKAIIFPQSKVRAHSELAWYFNCVARMGWLQRMTQFKDKAGKNSEHMSVGLFDYPVLQAADILIYKGTHVPVGEDQKQHLELTRDIAGKFNNDFGVDFFPLPEPLIEGPGARVMSLRDGRAKMSKSDPSDNSRINLTDDADTIAKKLKKAKTDLGVMPSVQEDLSQRPEVDNLIGIYSALSGQSKDAVKTQFEGQGFGVFKPALADLAVESLAPVTALMNRYLADPEEIDRILMAGADRAAKIADPVASEVRKIIGFLGS